MPKIGQLISKIQVGDKTFKNPEVWNSAHKMKKAAKKAQMLASIKANINLNTSYKICEAKDLNYDSYVSSLSSQLDSSKYAEFAPWSTKFNKMKQIILFKKGN